MTLALPGSATCLRHRRNHAVGHLGDFPHALGKIANDSRRAVGGDLIHRRDWRRDVQRRSGIPPEDSAQLPAFDQTLDECGRVGEQRPAGPERQLERAAAEEVM